MIPKVYKTTVYVTMNPNGRLYCDEMNSAWMDGYTDLGKLEISVPLDTSDETLQKLVDNIDSKIQTVRAESEAAVTELEARKQELLALPAPEES